MKTAILIILCFFAFQVEGQIKVSGYIRVGYLKESYSLNKYEWREVGDPIIRIVDGNEIEIPNIAYVGNVTRLENYKCMYSDVTLAFNWKWFTLEQKLYDVFTYEGGHTFKPLEIHYTTKFYWKWKFLKIGYEHLCLHPIVNNLTKFEKVSRRSSYDKIYVEFNFNNYEK